MKNPNIPENATKVMFNYGRQKGEYYVWETETEWYWHALGNDGSAKTQESAMNTAREWIINNKTGDSE